MNHEGEQDENKLVTEGAKGQETTGLWLTLRVAEPQSGTSGLRWGACTPPHCSNVAISQMS